MEVVGDLESRDEEEVPLCMRIGGGLSKHWKSERDFYLQILATR